MFFGEPFDFIKVDKMIVGVDAVLNGVEPFARHRCARTVGKVPASIKAHAKDRIARLSQRQHYRTIGLRAAMRLYICKTTIKQLLGALNCQCLYGIGWRTSLIVTLARISFGIFVGEHRALRLQHRF